MASPPRRPVVLRSATEADLEAVLRVVRADEEATIGRALTTIEDLRADWARASFDLRRDTRVAVLGDRVVGYGEESRGGAYVHVHPDVWGRGIGSTLVAWTEGHAIGAERGQVGQTRHAAATGAAALLQGRGYVRRWDSWILERALDRGGGVGDAPTALPDGIILRTPWFGDGPHDRGEAEAVHALIDRAFDDWPDREPPLSADDWIATVLERGTGTPDPDGVYVVAEHADDGLVGALIGTVEDGVGWVEQLAVAAGHRGHGVGTAMLDDAFRQFGARGLRRAAVSADSRTGVLTIYERVGMTVTDTFTRWSRHLDD